MSKNIIWLASYPKSGNTWLRLIIASLVYSKKIFNFDLLKNISEFESPYYFNFLNENQNRDFNNLTDLKTLSKYWLIAQRKFNEKNKVMFFKTHASNISYFNNNYTSPDTAKGVIYIIRDPRDVVISYSKHINKNIDEVIKIIQKSNTLAYSAIGNYPILISKWDYHLLSWLKLDIPKLVIKYEHLLENTDGVIHQIIKFIKDKLNVNIYADDNRIDEIIKNTNFKNLKSKEISEGFPEATKNGSFFSQGKANQWKNVLENSQKNKIENAFSETMKNFDYI